MFEILTFSVGMYVGYLFTKPTIKQVEERINDYRFFSEDKVSSFINAFEKGYETQHHMKPFIENITEAGVVQIPNEEGFIYEEPKNVEYEERIDGIYR